MVLMVLIEVCDDTLVNCIQGGFVMAENVCYRRKRVDPSAAESGPTWKLHDLVDKSP